jgi:membrane protein implicated in regulation of membrane protease activity
MSTTPPPDDDRTVRNKQIELTAGYLNSAATGFFGAGVIAPMAALTFGVSGPAGPVPALTLAVGATIFLVISIAAHIAARRLLRRLKP